MLLENKTAVIYGAGGAVGEAVARAFAKEGAKVFLTGHTLENVYAIKEEITAAGGEAYAAHVDALNKQEVENHLDQIISQFGQIDISFNLIGFSIYMGTPLVEMTQEKFIYPIETAMSTHFITATAAGRHMANKGSGVILALTAHVSRIPVTKQGGFGVTEAAIEALCRQLSVELGPQGVRVVCLRSAGSPDTPGVMGAMKTLAEKAGITYEQMLEENAKSTMLKRMPSLAEVADVAVLMASDRARSITAAATNVTCGAYVD
ncbi:SDR family NAD(P)-dependent oxidoreductase [Psychrobacillus sp. L3]|uniref:SDR family NAD(P)-dependent oxidoreductase n=1 Tax=Psychrobacillus sp. L3 TaxID=3236891 RepID=UPI0036F32885